MGLAPEMIRIYDQHLGERSFLNTISYIGPTIWNSLPEYLRNLELVTQFKFNLKEYLINKY